MAFSYNWLKTYFDKDIPPAAEIAEGIIFHAFEVEEIQEVAGDQLLEIKVLPDRAHDCLCHYGIAGEIAAIFDLPKREYSLDYGELKKEFSNSIPKQDIKIEIKNPDLCRRYIGRMVENITVKKSPDWLQQRLQSLGQRSINNIVDATNYVMLDIGQPLHAFDADKVQGNIVVRMATEGEKITTLDGKEVSLTTKMLVIADEQGPLAIAGIKGGNRSEVDENTKNIILESANFDPVNVRRTSFAINIRTDASKRFENELSPTVSDEAMTRLSSLIYDLAGAENLLIGKKIDVYPKEFPPRTIEVKFEDINSILGIKVPEQEVENILRRLDIKIEKTSDFLRLGIPARRMDLEVKENIAEEIGRIYGYDKIPSSLLDSPKVETKESEAEKTFRVAKKIREIMVKNGYSEVYGYSFTDHGTIELANPLAADKSILRTNLIDWMKEKLVFNLQYVLFDDEPVKVFEIGRVFNKNGISLKESTSFAIGVAGKTKKFKPQEEVAAIVETVIKELKLSAPQDFLLNKKEEVEIRGELQEFDFDRMAEKAGDFPSPNLNSYIAEMKPYKKVSSYPRVIRDVALWVPETTSEDEVKKVITESAGSLLTEGPTLFDRFLKDGRVSLAFRGVFQSYEKTLSDEEVNQMMDNVTVALREHHWEVR